MNLATKTSFRVQNCQSSCKCSNISSLVSSTSNCLGFRVRTYLVFWASFHALFCSRLCLFLSSAASSRLSPVSRPLSSLISNDFRRPFMKVGGTKSSSKWSSLVLPIVLLSSTWKPRGDQKVYKFPIMQQCYATTFGFSPLSLGFSVGFSSGCAISISGSIIPCSSNSFM